jgi:hypothetical protein
VPKSGDELSSNGVPQQAGTAQHCDIGGDDGHMVNRLLNKSGSEKLKE